MPATEAAFSAGALGPAVVDRARDLLRKRVAKWKVQRAALVEVAADALAAQDRSVVPDEELREIDATRPRFRFECLPGGPAYVRPCPYAMCRFNMFTVLVTCEQRLNSTPREPPRLIMSPTDLDPEYSCVLDIVDRQFSGYTLEEVGQILGVTRERIRQVQNDALSKIKRRLGNTTEGRTVLEAIEILLQEEESEFAPSFADL